MKLSTLTRCLAYDQARGGEGEKDEKRKIRFQSQHQNFWCCLAAAAAVGFPRVTATFFVCLSNLWMTGWSCWLRSRKNVSNEEIPKKCRSDGVCVYATMTTVESSVCLVRIHYIFHYAEITDLNVKYFYCLSTLLWNSKRGDCGYATRNNIYWLRGIFDTRIKSSHCK